MKEQDITKTGPQGHAELQALNNTSPFDDFTSDEIKQMINLRLPAKSSLLHQIETLKPAELSIGNMAAEAGFGKSKFDKDISRLGQLDELDNRRALAQPWLDKWANAAVKGVILAGTTFVQGTLGLLAGAEAALDISGGFKNMKWSGLWDNAVSNAIADITEWSEDVMPNYYSDYELESSWLDNVWTANFWGDKFLKNLGFVVGAYYSGAVVSKGLGSMKFKGLSNALSKGITATDKGVIAVDSLAKTQDALMKGASKSLLSTSRRAAYEAGSSIALKSATRSAALGSIPAQFRAGVGATISAISEGTIEAVNGTREWLRLQWEMAEDNRLLLRLDIINEYRNSPDLMLLKLDEVESNYEKILGEIELRRAQMGNMILGINIPMLTASNVIQFGRQYAGGFKTARSVKSNVARASGKTVGKTGTKEAGKLVSTMSTKKGIARSLLNPFSEGMEELSQEFAAVWAGNQHGANVASYSKMLRDPGSELEVVDGFNIFQESLAETLKSGDSWEQFWIGALTGGLGMPVFGKSFTGLAYIGKNKSVGLSGGIIGEMADYKAQLREVDRLIDHVNKNVSEKSKTYYQNLILQQYLGNLMDQAAEANNVLAYKTAEHGKLIADIIAHDRVGDIAGLINLIESAHDTSDAQLEALSDLTTVEKQVEVLDLETGQPVLDAQGKPVMKTVKVGPFVDANNNLLIDTEKGRESMREGLNSKKDNLINEINKYMVRKLQIDVITGQQFSDDQLAEVMYRDRLIENWESRSNLLAGELRPFLTLVRDGIKGEVQKYQAELDALKETKKYSELEAIDKQAEIDIITKRANDIDLILSLSDLNLGMAMTDIGILDAILKNADNLSLIDKVGYKIDAVNRKEFYDKAVDFKKLRDDITSHMMTLDTYMKNPGMVEADMIKAYKENVRMAARIAINNMSKAKTLDEVMDVINKAPAEVVASIYELVESSDNEQLKNLVAEYNKIKGYQYHLLDILGDIPDTDNIMVSVRDIINKGFVKADDSIVQSMDAVREIWNDYLNDTELNSDLHKLIKEKLRETIAEMDKRFDDAKKDQADKNKPEKPVEPVKKRTKKEALKDFIDDPVGETKKTYNKLTGKDKTDTTDSAEDIEAAKKRGVKKSIHDVTSKEVIDEDVETKDDTTLDSKKETKEDVKPKTSKEVIFTTIDESTLLEAEKQGPVDTNADVNARDDNSINGENFRSWLHSKYDFNLLNNRHERGAVETEGKPIVTALDKLGAFEFVDNGHLGRMLNKDKNTKIRYILSEDASLEKNVLLGVEVTSDMKADIAKNAISIDGKFYLIVGAVGTENRTDADGNTVAANEKVARSYAQLINDTKAERQLAKNDGFKGEYFVSDKYNLVKRRYSGRMVRYFGLDGLAKKNIINRNFKGLETGPVHLGFYFTENDFRTPTLNKSKETIIPLNRHNQALPGSVWLMTQEADGAWYAKLLNVARLNLNSYNLDANMNTAFILQLLRGIEMLIDPNSENRIEAWDIIHKYLHEGLLEDGERSKFIYYHDDNRITIKTGENTFSNNIGDGLPIKERAVEILRRLWLSDMNIRFQVSHAHLESQGLTYVEQLMESGILSTNLAQAHNVNASFDTFLYSSDTQGPTIPLDTEIAKIGHTGERGTDPSRRNQTVTIDGLTYTVEPGPKGKVRLHFDNKVIIDNVDRLAEILIAMIAKNIGKYHLEIGRYADGTRFGIYNSILFKDSDGTLQAKEAEIRKAEKNKKSEEARKKNLRSESETTKIESEESVEKKENIEYFSRPAPPGFGFSERVSLKIEGRGVLELGRVIAGDSTYMTVIKLEIEEDSKGKGIAAKLLKAALDKYGGKISSWVSDSDSAYLHYNLGFRAMKGEKVLSLEETQKSIEENSAVRMISDATKVETQITPQQAEDDGGLGTPVRTIELVEDDIALEEDKKRRHLLDIPNIDFSEYSQKGLIDLMNSFNPTFIPSNSKLHHSNKIKVLINMGKNFSYSDKFNPDLIRQIKNYASKLEKKLNNVVEKDLNRVNEITKLYDAKLENLKKEKADLLKLKEELLKETPTTQAKKALEDLKQGKPKQDIDSKAPPLMGDTMGETTVPSENNIPSESFFKALGSFGRLKAFSKLGVENMNQAIDAILKLGIDPYTTTESLIKDIINTLENC